MVMMQKVAAFGITKIDVNVDLFCIYRDCFGNDAKTQLPPAKSRWVEFD